MSDDGQHTLLQFKNYNMTEVRNYKFLASARCQDIKKQLYFDKHISWAVHCSHK